VAGLVAATAVLTAVVISTGAGSSLTSFTSNQSVTCPSAVIVGKGGVVVTTVSQGFPAGPLATNPCDGEFGIAFDGHGNAYASDQLDGNLYRFSLAAPATVAPTYLSDALGPGAYDVAFAPDGDLYGVEPSTNGNISAGAVVQLNPQNGAVMRVVTDQLTLPTWLAVDPHTGDLFVTNGGSGGYFSSDLWRIQDPQSTSHSSPPSVSVYSTDPSGFSQVAVAPGGTVYALNRDDRLVRFGDAATKEPAKETVVADVPSDASGGLAIGSTGTSAYVIASVLDRIDLSNGHVTTLAAFKFGGAISIEMGPDGCLYSQDARSIVRFSSAGGLCIPSAPSSSDVASYVPTPAQVSWSFRNIGESWFWVAVLIVLLGAASTLFNATLDANIVEIQGWFEPLRRRLRRKGAPVDQGPREPTKWRGWRGITLYLLIAGLVYTIRSPSIGTFADFAVGIAAGSIIGTEVTRRSIAKRRKKIGEPIALPSTLFVAAAFLAISALASARPGYVFGIIIGMTFVPALEDAESGAYSAFGAAFAFGIGLIAWFLRWPIAYGLDTNPNFFHRFVADVLAIIFVSSVCTVAFGMTPLRFLPGETVRKWHEAVWIVLWALGLFALVQILESGYGYASASAERTPTLVLGLVLLVVAVAFWAYFRRRKTSQPTGAGEQADESAAAPQSARPDSAAEAVAVAATPMIAEPTGEDGGACSDE
jgi:hypothetical protein